MSDYTTNFPPQTYSSSFYLNSLAEDESSQSNLPDGDDTKNTPILDCFISTTTIIPCKIRLLLFSSLLQLTSAQTTSKTMGCTLDFSVKPRIFSSLQAFQGSKISFDPDHSGYQGNIVSFSFQSIDRLLRNSFLSFGSNSIIKITLDHKGIKTIDVGAFQGLFCLHQLDLSYNNVSNLTEGVFKGLENLKVLNLSGNQLETVTDDGMAFYALTNLQTLDLSLNKIRSISRISFMPLTHLEKLNLGFNRLRRIEKGVFNYLTSLKELSLNNNQLMEIDLEHWEGLGNLAKLNLAGNYLRGFDTTCNFSFGYLEHLDLSSNFLTDLNVLGVRKHLSKLKVLDLSLNDFFCDDLEVIKHGLLDTNIFLGNSLNCTEVKTTRKATLPTETTTTVATTSAVPTKPHRDLSKEIMAQNSELLVSNRKLEQLVRNVQNILVYLFVIVLIVLLVEVGVRTGACRSFYDRCSGARRGEYLDGSDVENVILIRR